MSGVDRQGQPQGLTSADAGAGLKRWGPNELARPRRFEPLRQLLAWAGSPLIVILFLASVVSAAFGQLWSSAVIALMILLGVALNFTQAYRSQVAARRLRERVAQRATVVRDGVTREIPVREVVPGDVVHLGAGDLVPADGHLVSAKDLLLKGCRSSRRSLRASWRTRSSPTRGGTPSTSSSSPPTGGPVSPACC